MASRAARAAEVEAKATARTLQAQADEAGKAMDQARARTEEATDELVEQVKDPANLAALAKASLAAVAAEGSVEAMVAAGTQLAPAVASMGGALDGVVGRDVHIEPIYQEIDDEVATQKVDEAIGDMPRVEVISGLTVGFRDLSSMDTSRHVSDSGYLVLWRQGDHLVGFVYRSRREISLDKLVELAPRMIDAVRSATE
jgi:hypothetical protein